LLINQTLSQAAKLSKISGFETKKQLELYLLEEPREEYRIELDLDRKP
jgi:hypothetical protein